MKIFDCFMFYRELELLEVRLHELYPVVDRFVIVEATKTHSGKDKPMYLWRNEDNLAVLKKYLDKVTVIAFDVDYPAVPLLSKDAREAYTSTGAKLSQRWQAFMQGHILERSWAYENSHRQAILWQLQYKEKISAGDWAFISDLDEIPSREAVQSFRKMEKQHPFYAFDQRNSKGHINTLDANRERDLINGGRWQGTKAVEWSWLLKKDLTDQIRYRPGYAQEFPGCELGKVEDVTQVGGGWHLGYMGDAERVLDKLHNFAHTEFSGYTPEQVQDALSRGENFFPNPDGTFSKKIVIPFDDSYPLLMREQPERFERFVFKEQADVQDQ